MNNLESANELFHFTKKYDSIKSIMIDKFKPFFCVEDISYMSKEDENQIIAFPMVCFCDLPIERIAIHRGTYGNYGIGLTKEWGMKNSLNLVNYSYNNSCISAAYRILVKYYKERCQDLNDDLNNQFRTACNILLMTSKPYVGKMFNKADKKWSDESVRFYNEREWRYLPLVDRLDWSYSLEDYAGNYDVFLKAADNEQPKIQKQCPLDFTVNDITHIFLKYRSEKETFLNDIRNSYSEADLNRIESLMYIEED